MHPFARTLIAAGLAATTLVVSAGPRGWGPPPRHHHYHGPRVGALGGLAFGLALTLPLVVLAREADRAPDVVYLPPPAAPAPPVYAPPAAPAPVIYPRQGQSPAQLEADQRECNRWATTQPAAMADAGVFQRAVEACMDGRGYTLR